MTQNRVEMAKTFRDAANYVEAHGWIKGSVGKDGGPRCALGALASVVKADIPDTSEASYYAHARRDPLVAQTLSLAHVAMELGVPLAEYSLWVWNDLSCSDESWVIALFREVADQLDPTTPLPTTLTLVVERELQVA